MDTHEIASFLSIPTHALSLFGMRYKSGMSPSATAPDKGGMEDVLAEAPRFITINLFQRLAPSGARGTQTRWRRLSSRPRGLKALPPAIRADMEKYDYETGVLSSPLEFFKKVFVGQNRIYLQEIAQDIYQQAKAQGKRRLIWNILVILSELPYETLGEWASVLAFDALGNPYEDIVELAVRCFENWEDKTACSYLKDFQFDADWLQEYADDVCDYVEKEGREHNFPTAFPERLPLYDFVEYQGSAEDVLPEESNPWQMGQNGNNTTGDGAGPAGLYNFL